MSEGWGTAVGVLASFFSPEKQKERRRNAIEKIKRDMDDLTKQPETPKRVKRYTALGERLRVLEQAAKNS